jgi:hypothetical protein
VALDQSVNALLGPVLNWAFRSRRFGDPDETLSSVFGKEVAAGNRRARWVCRLLHWIDSGHCEKSIERDEGDA